MLTTTLNGAAISCTQVERGTALLRNNLGFHVGDDPDKVGQERARCAAIIGTPIIWMNQTHSTHVHALTLLSPHATEGQTGALTDQHMRVQWGEHISFPTVITPEQQIEADGLFLDTRAIPGPTPALAVMTADCLPVIFSDPTGTVIAAVHAGRVGLENGILLQTVALYEHAGINPADVAVYIGPAICGQCYEVPEDMATRSVTLLPHVRSQTSWGTPALDLPSAARAQLITAGVGKVQLSGICTYESPEFHSYRRNKGCGRHATIVRAASDHQ